MFLNLYQKKFIGNKNAATLPPALFLFPSWALAPVLAAFAVNNGS